MSYIDIVIITIFISIIIAFILYKRNKEHTNFFFISGNGLSWPLIGISVIAANISTEHFIGMAGAGYTTGMAVASHEWTAAIALVIISLYVLPKYMSLGVKTIPEYLEYRFNHWTRLILSVLMILFTIFIQFAAVIYGGSLAIETIFNIDRIYGMLLLSALSALFTLSGGLTSVVQSNTFFAVTFFLGGIILTLKGIEVIGGIDVFVAHSEGRLTALLPASNNFLPWTSALLGGLWVAQYYYFGFNQFITQYLISGKTLSEAQKGVLFAASIKLLIPFIAVFPGIIAFELLGSSITEPDQAYPMLVALLSKYIPWLSGLILCTLIGAAISSLNSMLMASSKIFTLDIYLRYFKPMASETQLNSIGRIVTLILIILGCLWAPFIEIFHGSFEYVQKFAGMISPGVLCVFILAMFTKRIPVFVAVTCLIGNIPLYLILLYYLPGLSYYDIMGITFLVLLSFSFAVGNIFLLKKPVIMPEKFEIKFERNLLVIIWSIFLLTTIAFLYMLFL